MQYIQARSHIESIRNPKSRMDAHSSSHWVVIFFDNANKTIHAYDARDPVSCLDSITKSHPSFEYITAKGMPTVGAAAEWAKAFRLVADLTPELLTMLELGRKSS